jgi:small multidrug resistance family-3 protein
MPVLTFFCARLLEARLACIVIVCLPGNLVFAFAKLALLFAITAVAEIVGCYLPWLVLKGGRTPWLLLPAALSLALFAWVLTLHPTAAGRTYAAYGGMYIAVALVWLRVVDGVALTRWDVAGAGIALVGMAVIALQPAT